MQTLRRPHGRRPLSAILLCLGILLLCPFGAVPAHAQVLAKPNWAGSGVTMEPWWQRAVFYRIDPSKFQATGGSGRGDLAGVTERLDYLQSLGVDALVLKSISESLPSDAAAISPNGQSGGEFDDLARAAVGRHLRVLVELGAPASQSADAQYLGLARAWLNQGAAGLYIPTRALEKVDGTEHIALLLHQLRALTDSFPGARVLLADAPTAPDLAAALAKETQLTASAALVTTTPATTTPTETATAAASLRAQLTAALADRAAGSQADGARRERHAAAMSGGNPLLVAERVPDGTGAVGLKRALAVMLLASRAAVMLDYGQELGLDAAGKNAPLMQWTPDNGKAAPKPPPALAKKGPVYEGFQPYVPPLPKNLLPPPTLPNVVESFDLAPVLLDPATLPGFTTGIPDAALTAPNGATANVAMEENDPQSLLHLYRQLIRLHHENATVRNGAETLLDYDALDAVVVLRKAPASSRTSSNVVAACNLSSKPVALGDLGGVSLRGLRSLLHPWPVGDMRVIAPGQVLVGEGR